MGSFVRNVFLALRLPGEDRCAFVAPSTLVSHGVNGDYCQQPFFALLM